MCSMCVLYRFVGKYCIFPLCFYDCFCCRWWWWWLCFLFALFKSTFYILTCTAFCENVNTFSFVHLIFFLLDDFIMIGMSTLTPYAQYSHTKFITEQCAMVCFGIRKNPFVTRLIVEIESSGVAESKTVPDRSKYRAAKTFGIYLSKFYESNQWMLTHHSYFGCHNR